MAFKVFSRPLSLGEEIGQLPESYLTVAQLGFHPNSGMDKSVTSLFAVKYGSKFLHHFTYNKTAIIF